MAHIALVICYNLFVGHVEAIYKVTSVPQENGPVLIVFEGLEDYSMLTYAFCKEE